MKKSVLLLGVGVMVIGMAACHKPVEAPEPQVEEVVEETVEEVVEEPAEETEENEEEVGLANPWSASSAEEAMVGRSFVAPEGAENIEWSKMEGDGNTLYQMTFDLDGRTYTAREQISDEAVDISGTYYDWTVSEDIKLQNWADGNMTGTMYRYIGDDEWVDLCTWFDVEIGTAYSLTVSDTELDGFDITAIASAMCPQE